MIKKLAVVVALVLGWGFSLGLTCTFGQEAVTIRADEQFAFAESYYERQEYYRAISEYERFLHFFPQDPRSDRAMHRIGESYLKGNRHQQALAAFRRLADAYTHRDFRIKAYYGMAEAHNRSGRPKKAVSTLEALKSQVEDRDVIDDVLYRQGWLYLDMKDWEQAQKHFDGISPSNRRKYRLKQLSKEINKHGALQVKNPKVAGCMAILPGAGHLYCGRHQDALIAFALNGAMIWAAYEAFENDHDVLGGVITFFELGLYSGNIYSAVNCAHKYNRNQEKDFLHYLKQHSVLKASVGRDVVVSYSLTF